MSGWREVGEEEFWRAIGQKDCHPVIVPGSRPYASVFKTRSGEELGKSVGRGDHSGLNDYYLPAIRQATEGEGNE